MASGSRSTPSARSQSPFRSLTELQKLYRLDLEELLRRVRFLELPIYPSKDGIDRHGNLHEDDLPRLEALNQHLDSGGVLESFSDHVTLPEVLPPHQLKPVQREDLEAHNAGGLLSTLQTILSGSGPFTLKQLRERFEFLDDCAERSWLLTTEQLSEVLGLQPSTLSNRARAGSAGESSFRWQSWIFTQVGREGRESLWRITGPSLPPSSPPLAADPPPPSSNRKRRRGS